mmetsp:Transcript_30291/g.73029  ORF Transcript_30291/g.73029 Transcript_30291/m.73029 type:complete len:176 (-) Transcript_30291:22-549(-)
MRMPFSGEIESSGSAGSTRNSALGSTPSLSNSFATSAWHKVARFLWKAVLASMKAACHTFASALFEPHALPLDVLHRSWTCFRHWYLLFPAGNSLKGLNSSHWRPVGPFDHATIVHSQGECGQRLVVAEGEVEHVAVAVGTAHAEEFCWEMREARHGVLCLFLWPRVKWHALVSL